MAYTDPSPVDGRTGWGEGPVRRAYWPLAGAAAGLLGGVATLALDLHLGDLDNDTDTMTIDQVGEVSATTARLSFLAGYLAVALLLVTAAAWRRHVEPRVPGSTAARVVPAGLTASAGALMLGYGWKGAMAIYGDGGPEDTAFDRQGQYVYFMLNDFGSFIGWLGVLIAAGAVTWMSLRERTISPWLGWLSALLTALPAIGFLVMSVPGLPGITMPAWMLITFLGLTYGKSTITR
ncbi:hypothetical protein LO772_13715 [Yinghuangia sp. ASG 101]|uniref:hypothetical protein n=1 Tax=Yinghuangia sp. ASG 101 TaxID=2896848 RepID=UPI001E441099|nr:hypothetical protein [Yinghuangia sp. ASG 101]UGQ14544.1 hypothetical protein LO772_13715 [Yinghuangia sp. ASG 101]